jgi:hypothetical protein
MIVSADIPAKTLEQLTYLQENGRIRNIEAAILEGLGILLITEELLKDIARNKEQ